MIGGLLYLQKELGKSGNFFNEYRVLSDEDKETLKKWAVEEQIAMEKK